MQNSDFKFPHYVTGIQDVYGEWLAGGYDFQTQAPGWTRYTICNGIREFSGDELTGEVIEPGIFQSDPLTVWEYPNGYTVKVKFRQESGTPTTRLIIEGSWYDLEGNSIGNVYNVVDGYLNANTYYNGEYGNIRSADFKIKVYFDTVYYPIANPPADTANNGIGLFMYCGFESYGFDFNVGNWAQKGDQHGEVAGCPYRLAGYNLENFTNYLHSHGNEFGGDPFTDEPIPGEPAGGDDTSHTGGGGGNYDPTSDPVDFPVLPTGGALTSGMIKGFVMNSGNLIGLQSKLWDMSFFDIITQYQKLINDPINCIISLHCLPVTPPESAQPEEIKLGSFPTTISANRVTAQYVEVDGGTIHVDEYWGSALDYAPFTNVEMFVPFCGFKNIQVEDIQGLDLHLKYHVDCFTGDCVAYLKCGASVLYSWTGNCKGKIPCTANSNDLLANQIAPLGAIGLGIVTGNPASTAAGAISGAVNSATAKNHVQRSGEVAGYSGLMSEFNAYLIFHRPRQSLAKNYKNMRGYACNITYKLNQVKGFTMVDYVHLKGISGATDTELAEIEALLKEGVII